MKKNVSQRDTEVEFESSVDEVDDLTRQTGTAGANKKGKSAAKKRASLPFPIWHFINTNNCRRDVVLKFFEDDKADPDTYAGPPPSEHCCGNYSPKRRYTPVPATPSARGKAHRGSHDGDAHGIVQC